MTSLCKRALTGVALALGLLSGTTAQAAFITATFDNVSPHDPSNGSAGQFNWHTTSTLANVKYIGYDPLATGTQYANHFVTFCIQNGPHVQYISPGGTYTYEIKSLESAPNGNGAAPMLGLADQIRRMWTADRAGIVGSMEKSAAFQYAIWQILGQFTYGGGNSTIQSYITSFIADSNNTSFARANIYAMTNDSDQDQIIELKAGFSEHGDNLEPTPAPAALVLALAGIAPCLALRRRLRGQVA